MDKIFAQIIFWGAVTAGLYLVTPFLGEALFVFAMFYIKNFLDSA